MCFYASNTIEPHKKKHSPIETLPGILKNQTTATFILQGTEIILQLFSGNKQKYVIKTIVFAWSWEQKIKHFIEAYI